MYVQLELTSLTYLFDIKRQLSYLGTIHILNEHVLGFFALYDIIIGAINLHAR